MKVELDDVILGYSGLSDRVFAGITNSPHTWRHKVDVTQSFLACVIHKWGGTSETITHGDKEWEITVKKIK